MNTKLINVDIESAEQNIARLGQKVTGPDGQVEKLPSANQATAMTALGNEHEIIRLAKRLVDPFLCEVPVLKAQLRCRKEVRNLYAELLK